MYKYIGLILLWTQSVFSAVVPITVSFEKDGENYELIGSGIVVGNIGKKSIVVASGHQFYDKKITSIDVHGKPGKLLYNHCSPDPTPKDEDMSIIEVDVVWQPLWRLVDALPNEHIKPSGWVGDILITLNGYESEKYFIKECVVIPGQSGGPVVALRNNRYVCVGSVVGYLKGIEKKEDGSSKIHLLGKSNFCPADTIRKRLNEYAKGWENE